MSADRCAPVQVPSNPREGRPIPAGVTHGCWSKGNEKHAYALPHNESSGGAGYKLVLDAATQARFCLAYYDQDGNGLAAGGCNGADGAPIKGWVGVAPRTNAFVVVETVYAPSPVPYRFSVDVVPVNEPAHHDQASATPVQLGKPVTGYSQFLINGDALHDDFFVIELKKAGTYEVLVADAAPTARMFVEAYDRDKNRVWGADVRDEGANLRAQWKAKKGTYYLKLADYIGGHKRMRMSGGTGELSPAFTRPYTVTVTAK